MTHIAYIEKRFRREAREVVDNARRICATYAEQGFDLTLRQLYYQFVAHDLFAESRKWRQTTNGWVRSARGTKNAEPNYKYLGQVINDARMAGLLSWEYIVDRTRTPEGGTGSMSSPVEVIDPDAYRIDKWDDQPYCVEVWIEKEALAGVLTRACPTFEIVHFSCRGYTSQSAMWRAAQRHGRMTQAGKAVRIIHLGDHDPSGVDMTRDIAERLGLFIAQDLGEVGYMVEPADCLDVLGDRFRVERIALNMDQIREHNPPPNPAKLTDSRASGYIREFGDESWELDALDPNVLVGLIQDAVGKYRDDELWQAKLDREASEREPLERLREQWPDVVDFLDGQDVTVTGWMLDRATEAVARQLHWMDDPQRARDLATAALTALER